MAPRPEDLQEALGLLRLGRLEQAEQKLLVLLDAEPGDFSARHLLGVVQMESGRPGPAIGQFDLALQANPGAAIAHYNRGNALSELRRLEDAVASYDQAIRLQPALVEAIYNRGNALRELGRGDQAIASYLDAIALKPGLFQAHNNLGSVLRERGQLDAALASFERVLAIKPDHVEALNNKGLVLQDLRRTGEALAAFDAAVGLAPNLADAHRNRGQALQRLGRLDEAIASYDRAISLDDDSETFNIRGIALHEARQFARALEDYDRAIALKPDFVEAWNNRGNALHDLRQVDEALQSYQHAVDLKPDFAEAINNRGMVRQDLRRLDAARSDYDQAIALRPDYPEALKRRASLKLLQGDFIGGWADFEANLRQLQAPIGLANRTPWWRGESLAGRSILLSEPNGLGDTLQFIRFVPLLLEQGARVSFTGPASFSRLLGSFSSELRFVQDADDGHYDYRCQLWSLPHYLRIGIDSLSSGAVVPYLRAEPALVESWARLLDPTCFNIGICWQGNPTRKIDAGRSIPLTQFLPLANLPGVRLLSLQKHFGLDQLESLPAGMQVDTIAGGFDDGPDAFVDSAALLQNLDLVVAADTSITHLAGALGRPAWLALNSVPDWRWMLDRSDSPWYPSVRLFRQQRLGDWQSVFAAMADALAEEIASRGGAGR